MSLAGPQDIDEALARVGELLTLETETYAIVVVGGAAMNLLGLVERVTTDVDIVAFGRPIEGQTMEIVEALEGVPTPLARAAATVAHDLGLSDQWLNTGPALQWSSGFPPGFAQRIHWRRYDALQVGLVDRRDLIFFKLYAAADDRGPDSVHFQDLLALRPNPEELEAARDWVASQDASQAFGGVLEKVVSHVRNELRRDGSTEPNRPS